MKKIFKEYHQFTEHEFQKLWKDCLFVFDTNTLLNMYRYSRATVNAYFDVLNELKKKKQIWIPYQVGYEFYENRIDVISEYEKSYDDILSILDKAKSDIEAKYKDHPFLDLCKIKEEMNKGLSGVETKIKQAKKDHPKWLEKDEVLDRLNQLFDGNIGNEYDEKRLNEIRREGKERYEKKIPPGFKDDKKPEDKKYGDFILWCQIIDKAKESKSPIVLISGDVKEDWWLEKDGKRIMPLPQLKKEILDKAGVDFHIYTADRFLELNKTQKKSIDDNTIKEVRKIRELEEKRMMMKRMEAMERDRELGSRIFERYSVEAVHLFAKFEGLMMKIKELEICQRDKETLIYLFHRARELRNMIIHGVNDRVSIERFYRNTKEILFILSKIIHSEDIHPEVAVVLREYIDIIEHLNHKF
ncbi:MAG: PIN domain-containing protein [Candidatus Omnitrophica bacterium]|nr:PIN domain-containing protein [Candidatus Omnitrophota bacterium]